MRKFSVEQVFDFSLEELFLARETRYSLERPWPEVRKVKVNSKKETGQKLHVDRMLFIDPGLPEFISITLGSPVLKIHEVLTYRRDEGTFKVVVELQFSKSIVDFQEVTYHNSITDNKSSRRIEASVHSPIPLLGSKLEKMLEDEFKGQSEKDYKRLIKIMQANE